MAASETMPPTIEAAYNHHGIGVARRSVVYGLDFTDTVTESGRTPICRTYAFDCSTTND